MTTTTILLLCLVAFLVIVFYKLFFSQTDEIPTNNELKPLPTYHKTTRTSEANSDTNPVNEIASQQQGIFYCRTLKNIDEYNYLPFCFIRSLT